MPDIEAQGRFRSLVVDHVVQEAKRCCSLVLSTPQELRDLFRPDPGQFLTVRATIDGRAHVRCYSVSSLLFPDEPLRITIKRVESGVVSRWLNDTIQPGDRLMVAAPAGRETASSHPPTEAFRSGLVRGQTTTARDWRSRSGADKVSAGARGSSRGRDPGVRPWA